MCHLSILVEIDILWGYRFGVHKLVNTGFPGVGSMEHLFCHVWLVLFLFNLLGQRIFRFIAFFALVLSYYHDTCKGCDDDNHA